ncbi:MAG: PD40 domain-containing protein [Bacteroidetes bacterium]|nr:PD40 domain-containing protein [Bacteroidota bacterium]
MNKLTTIIAFIFFVSICSFTITGQTAKQFKHAEDYVDVGDYLKAKLIYLDILKTDSNNYKANEELGLLLVEFMNEKEVAIRYIQKALKLSTSNENKTELFLALAECQQYRGEFKDAIETYQTCLKGVDKSEAGNLLRSQINQKIENCQYGLKNPKTKNLARYKVKNLGENINSISSEYAPVIAKKGNVLLFTTRRKENLGGKTDDRDAKFFEDMYVSYKQKGKFTKAKQFAENDPYIGAIPNTSDHDAVVSLSNDEQQLFLYKQNGIYTSDLVDDVWSAPVRMPETINEPSTFEAHATISKDGRTLYFSSNRPGGFGGMDIYKSVKGIDGTWQKPVNLGEQINTKEDEDSPFLSKDEKTFYFASKGLNGYGGYDIFRGNIDNGNIKDIENIGPPFNSGGDDIYFSINEDETIGFLSSNRNGGFGEMDIYEIIYFDKAAEGKCNPIVNQKPNDNLYIDFTSKDSIFVNDSIKFDASISKIKNASIVRTFWRLNDSLVFTDTTSFTKKFTKEGKYTIRLSMALLTDTAYERQDFCITKNITVFNPKVIDDFFEPVMKKDEEKIVIKGTADVATIKIDSTKKDILKIKLDPIFFDSDKFAIRKDASKTMDANIAKMKVDKNIIIKVTAHTDSKASREYNLKLSQKRADAAIAYLGKKGIKKDRILAVVAMGETQLINDCGDDKKCAELQNQQNRRVEFKIIGSKPVPVKAAKTPVKKGGAKKPAAKKK